MTRFVRLLAAVALLAASRGASAQTALFNTLQADGAGGSFETIGSVALRPDGTAGPVADVVRDPSLWLGSAYPRFSPDRTRVLFRASDGALAQPDRLLVVPAAGGAPLDITPAAPVAGLLSGASWTPDGSRVLVVGVLQPAAGPWNHEIFSVPAAGGGARQLTFDADGGSKFFPVTSPDGRWIAYVWERPDAYALAVLPATGGRPRVLDVGVAKDVAPSWSPDSKAIAYTRFDVPAKYAGTYSDVFRVEVPSGARRNLTKGAFRGVAAPSWQGSVVSPTFSPGGKSIAFVYVEAARPSERGVLYVMPAAGGAAVRVGDGSLATYGVSMGLAWTPDGARILYPYIDSDALDPTVWSWNQGLAAVNVATRAVTRPLVGPFFPGLAESVTVR